MFSKQLGWACVDKQLLYTYSLLLFKILRATNLIYERMTKNSDLKLLDVVPNKGV